MDLVALVSAWFKRLTVFHLAVGVTIAACAGVLLPTPFVVRMLATTMLALFLPGWWLLQATGLNAGDWLEQIVLSAGLSYGVTVLGALGVLYVAGRLAAVLVIGFLFGLQLVLMVVCLWRRNQSAAVERPCRRDLIYFLLPVGVTAAFCFANVGYADYWGDEMNGLLRAVAIILGRPETIFEHTKGPVEILLPAVFGLLVGRFEPFALRFPSGLALTLGIGSYFLLARNLFDRRIGLVAAVTLAINGLYLAYGRHVQYQAVVLLMTNLSLLMAYRFYRSGEGRYLASSGFLIGVGLLTHYDMLLLLPPIGWLVWRCLRRRVVGQQFRWAGLAGAGLILLMAASLFYLPYFLHPHLAKTSSYLGRIIGAADWPANNFDELYMFMVMYNSAYFGLVVAVLGAGKVLADLYRLFFEKRRDRTVWVVVGTTFVLCLLAITVGRASFVPLLACALVFVLLVGFSHRSVELRLVYLWMGVAFIGYMFLVDHPRNHLQVIFPGWSLLVALAVTDLYAALQHRFADSRYHWPVAGAIGVALLLLGLFAYYQHLLFVDTEREYVFTYPEHKPPLYWEDPDFPFGARRPYGTPHRLGWQMINQLYLEGTLQGDWDSNDYSSNLFWYTLGFPRNPCYPRYYFRTQFHQKEGAGDSLPKFSLTRYVHVGQVRNRNRLQIDVYEFAPQDTGVEITVWPEPARYGTYVKPEDFRAVPYATTVPRIPISLTSPFVFRPGPSALQVIADHYGDPRILNVRDEVAVVGYDLDDTWAVAGGVVVVTLYWQATEVVNLPYKVFVHLEGESVQDSGPMLWSQADDFPACGTRPTQGWQVDQIVADRHVVDLPAAIPEGDYVLRVGLYEPGTLQRMDLLDSLGNPQGTDFDLSAVTVRPRD